jgi:DNA-binding NarL/FixJ family response regulator
VGTRAPESQARIETTILVVDDDLSFLRAAKELLAERGYRVVGQATTAREAVTECDRLRPDAVLLDIRLPDGNGVALIETLRAGPSPPQILLTSTDAGILSPEQVRRSGASGFIPKSRLARSDLDVFFNGETSS